MVTIVFKPPIACNNEEPLLVMVDIHYISGDKVRSIGVKRVIIFDEDDEKHVIEPVCVRNKEGGYTGFLLEGGKKLLEYATEAVEYKLYANKDGELEMEVLR